MHTAAQVGFSTEAKTYSTGRPDYPDALRAWLAKPLGVNGTATVIDLGAGTGKLTRLLIPAANIIAIEPLEAMRAEFTRHLPGIEAVEGIAEAIPLPDGTADALVCAQAFHWFATVEALREIHRVLTPGGRLGLVWNVRDESVDWVAALTAITDRYEGDAPRFQSGKWRQAFDCGLFTEPQVTRFAHTHSGSPQAVIVDRFLSVSFIAALPPDEKARVADQLHQLVNDHPALRGKEVIDFPYHTDAYVCRRVDGVAGSHRDPVASGR